jgi:hypothetical protein
MEDITCEMEVKEIECGGIAISTSRLEREKGYFVGSSRVETKLRSFHPSASHEYNRTEYFRSRLQQGER